VALALVLFTWNVSEYNFLPVPLLLLLLLLVQLCVGSL
jgi:hypothetical protein